MDKDTIVAWLRERGQVVGYETALRELDEMLDAAVKEIGHQHRHKLPGASGDNVTQFRRRGR